MKPSASNTTPKSKNYYERVIKKKQAILLSPDFRRWANKEKLTSAERSRAALAIIKNRSSFM